MFLSKRGNIKQFNLVIYPVDFTVVIGDLEEEVNKFYKTYDEHYNYIGKPTNTGACYRVVEKETSIPCVMIWIKAINEFTSSIVAHECGHAAMEIFSYIGTKPNPDDQEPYCYLLGNLVRLAVGCFYEIPGIEPPKISKDTFENPERPKKPKTKKK